MGLPVGVALGGALAEAVGWRSVFFIVAVPGALVAILVFTVREPLRGLGDRIDQMRGGTTGRTPTARPRSRTATRWCARRASCSTSGHCAA